MANDEELQGDFEDLETGEKHGGLKVMEPSDGEESSDEGEGGERLTAKQKLIIEKKRKKKEMLEHLNFSDDKNHFDFLKEELGKQAELNKTAFSNMPDSMRVQYEGFRSGMYVRMRV